MIGKIRDAPWPCIRLANSAMNALESGGFSFTISARTSTTSAGALAATVNMCSIQYAARSRAAAPRPPGQPCAEILQQRQPQHDRDRPKLAEPKGGYRPVRRHERVEAFEINSAIDVRDQFQCDGIKCGGYPAYGPLLNCGSSRL